MRRKEKRIKRVKHVIRFGDTSVDRDANLYRFQIEEYPDYDILRMYKNYGRRGNEKFVKTIYDNNGYAWLVRTDTGEIVRRRQTAEIKRSVDGSLARTRKVMREILMANHWDWFVTLTFNNSAQDRTDDEAVMKQFEKFRRYIRKAFPNMYYMAVMERHKDGTIHFHLPVGGISAEELRLVDSGHKDKNGRPIYNCYAWKYGFSTVTAVGDTEKVSGYILKYIGKDLGVSADFKKRYWASRNCNRPRKRFVDMVSDFKADMFSLFDSVVDRTLGMVIQYWNKARNYLAVKDHARGLRKIRFWFDNFNLSAHDDFGLSSCMG